MNKRPNVRFHVVEGAEIQTKSIENPLSEIQQKISKLWETYGHPSMEVIRTSNRHDQKTTTATHHIRVKMLQLCKKERILKCAREQCQLKYKSNKLEIPHSSQQKPYIFNYKK
jgi:hypothetical protein